MAKIKINNKEHDIPFDPDIITLDDYISYYDMYGKQLDKELSEIVTDDLEEEEKYIAYDNHLDKEAIAWFSFWSKVNLYDAENYAGFEPLLESYRIMRTLFFDAEKQAKDNMMQEVNWKGDIWRIQDFKINPASIMSFNEVVTSKEIMRQVKKFETGKWVALKYLSVVFFRRLNEKFIDQMVWEDSPRMKLMGELPVSHAMKVGFFLSSCVNSWSKTLAFFQETEILRKAS